MITVDYYKEKDFHGLLELMKHWGKDYSFPESIIKTSLSDIFKNTDNVILIAKDENKIVGYAQIAKCFYLGFEPFIEVIQLLVAEESRSTGVGQAIMKRVEDEAAKEKILTIKLHSQVHRSRAHVFYEKLGYAYYKISKFYEKKLG
jgi:GNAT superfamily N-acetyltransferase